MDDGIEPVAEDIQLLRVLAALAARTGWRPCGSSRVMASPGAPRSSELAGLPMTKPTFSHHLRILREAGIIAKRIQGAKGDMSLRKADLDRRFPGLIDSVLSADTQPVAR